MRHHRATRDVVEHAVGTPAVCEPAALLAPGRLELAHPEDATQPRDGGSGPRRHRSRAGQLAVVGLGPGAAEELTASCSRGVDVGGSGGGLPRLPGSRAGLARGKALHGSPIGEEVQRCRLAVTLCRQGQRVALVSSGDAGVYGTAGIVFELLDQESDAELANRVTVVPGVTAQCRGRPARRAAHERLRHVELERPDDSVARDRASASRCSRGRPRRRPLQPGQPAAAPPARDGPRDPSGAAVPVHPGGAVTECQPSGGVYARDGTRASPRLPGGHADDRHHRQQCHHTHRQPHGYPSRVRNEAADRWRRGTAHPRPVHSGRWEPPRPQYRIRRATCADAPAIARVHIDSWRTTYPGILPDEFLANLTYERREVSWRRDLCEDPDEHELILVVEDGDRGIVSFASGGPEHEHDPEYSGELYRLYLLSRPPAARPRTAAGAGDRPAPRRAGYVVDDAVGDGRQPRPGRSTSRWEACRFGPASGR